MIKIKLLLISVFLFTNIIVNNCFCQNTDSYANDTIIIHCKQGFNRNFVRIFRNDTLIEECIANSGRNRGATSCFAIIPLNKNDIIEIECGFWRRGIKTNKGRFIFVRRFFGIGYLWVNYKKRVKIYR